MSSSPRPLAMILLLLGVLGGWRFRARGRGHGWTRLALYVEGKDAFEKGRFDEAYALRAYLLGRPADRDQAPIESRIRALEEAQR